MANTRIQVKRSSVSGRTPNVSNPSNTSYIAPGEFALNMADGLLYTSNGTSSIIVGASQKNLSAETLAANSVTIANGISVGNSTVNASINSTSLFAGNSAVNTVVNTTYISVSNTISNSSLSPRIIFVGNSTVNTLIDTTGGTSTFTIYSANIDSTGKATIQTTTAHGLTKILNSKIIINSSLNTLNTENYSVSYKSGFNILDIPTANTVSFTIPIGNYKASTGDRNIKTIQRANGVATVVTTGSHEFANGTQIFIPKFTPTKGTTIIPFSTTGSTANVINSTAFSYTNGPSDLTLNMFNKSYSIPGIEFYFQGSISMTFTYPGHTLSVGDTVDITGLTPNSFICGTQTFTINGKFLIASVVPSTSFTTILGFKKLNTSAVNARSGTFSAGTIKRSSNEGPFNGGIFDSHIGQLLPTNTSITGGFTINNPVGISINNGNTLIRVTDTLIYVGNTSIGTIFDQTGPRTVKV